MLTFWKIHEIIIVDLRKQGLINEATYWCAISALLRQDFRQFKIFLNDNIRNKPNYLEAAENRYNSYLNFNEEDNQ